MTPINMIRAGLGGAVLALAACQMPAPEGSHLYGRHCAACHGESLRGDGPLAAQLPIAPPDLTGLASRNGGTFPMVDVIAQIHGYPGRHHQGLMPEFAPELSEDNTTVTALDGTRHAVPTEILRIAQYLETKQQ